MGFGDTPCHAQVRWWPSLGKKFSKFLRSARKTCQFSDSKGRDAAVLQDAKWKSELAFLAAHLSVLKLQLQEEAARDDDTCDAVKASRAKLLSPETHLQERNFS